MVKQAVRLLIRFSFLSLLVLTATSCWKTAGSQAAETQKLQATVKISVCGNGIVEGGETCEQPGSTLTTCNQAGAVSYKKTCDISCGVVIEQCPFTITPTTSGIETVLTPTLGSPTPQPEKPLPITILPERLFGYDTNSDKRLSREELASIVRVWVESWKSSMSIPTGGNVASGEASGGRCDLNGDKTCGPHDLSILFYYVDR